MSKKLILFLMLALFGSTSFLRADDFEVQIGDGTNTTGYFPFYTLYNYSIAENLFLASELEAAGVGTGEMTSLSWYASNETGYEQQGISIWMANVTDEELTTSSHVVTGMTLVYTGSVTPTTGWNEFVLNEDSFAWDGTSNLLIFCQRNNGAWNSTINWQYTAASFNAVSYRYQDSGAYDVTVSNTMYTGVNRPNIIFKGHNDTPTPPTPPTPTGDLTITPSPFELAYRPVNGWMEPYSVKITNGGSTATIEGTLSNTSGDAPFALSVPVSGTLETGDIFAFDVEINNTANGEYTEEFTLFYALNSKDIITVPVTGTIYTAAAGDIVETAKSVTWSSDSYSDTPDLATIHPNYNLYGMTEQKPDVIYKFTLNKDSRFHATGGDDFIAVYNYGANTHLTAAVEPVLEGTSGIIDDEILLAGTYYLVVASNNISDVEMTREIIPAPLAITALTPADGATNVSGTIVLTWVGGENATEYRVLFGTSPTNMPAVLDWTMVDENYGSYDVTNLAHANTQYFWKVEARNSNGTVSTERFGFTTALTTPNTVTASDEEIFVDGSTLIRWKHSAGGGGVLPETQIGTAASYAAYLPTYNLYNYSYTQQIFTGEEIGSAGTINSISFYTYSNTSNDTRNLTMYMVNTDKTSFSGGSDWVEVTSDDIVFQGAVTFAPSAWTTLELSEPFAFDGSNLIIAVNDLTGTWTSSIQFYQFEATSQALRIYNDDNQYNPANPGSGTVMNTKNTIIINKDGAKAEPTREFLSFNIYDGDTKLNTAPITEKQYLVEGLSYDMTGHNIAVTAVYDEGESEKSAPVVVKVSGYGKLQGAVTELISGAPIQGVTVTFEGKDEFQNAVTYTGTTNGGGVYTINNVKAGTYNIGVATLDGMEPAHMDSPVTLAYQGTETIDFVMHEEYKPVLSVLATEVDPSMSKVQWSINTMISGGGTGGGNGDEFFVDFEDSAIPAGWTTIDGGSPAGYGWQIGSTKLGGTGNGHNASLDLVLSQSYDNNYGVVYPDNYLVSPQVRLGATSTFSFWACGQDASYAGEHCGVFVSETGTGDWTMVGEWTLTSKGEGQPTNVTRSGSRDQGTWYQKTVDLGAYAGQQMYIAIRHFNCSDMFYLDVDDIELANADKGRSVQYYSLYRKAILKEAGLVPADSALIADNYTDTLYADFNWDNMDPGLYQYGVSAVYPSPSKGGTRDEVIIGEGTGTTYYFPIDNYFNYSVTEQIYTAEEIGMGGTINAVSFYYNYGTPYTANNVTMYMKNVARSEFATTSDCEPLEAGDIVWTGAIAPTEAGWYTFTLDTPFQYDGTSNLLVAFYDGTSGYPGTSYTWRQTTTPGSAKMALRYYSDSTNPDPYNLASYTGSKQTYTYRGNVMIDIIPGGGGGNDNPVTPITWSNVLPKDMNTTVTVNVNTPAGVVESARVEFINQFEAGTDFSGEIAEGQTSLTFDEFRKGEYTLTVELEGFTSDHVNTPVSVWGDENVFNVSLTEILTPVDGMSVSCTGFAVWTDMMPAPERPVERYMVKLNGVYVAETADYYYQFDEATLTIGQTYTAEVAVIYSMGMSAFVSTTFTYEGCAGVATQVEDLNVDEELSNCDEVTLVWNGGTPTPTPPTPPTPPSGNTFDFDDSTLQGWTTYDGGNPSGYGWSLGSDKIGTGYGHNGSNDMVLSQSYDNNYGVVYPDNYLISPQKAEYTGVSLWACGQDASYAAEHFGIAVSTGNSISDFVMVNEWTIGSKGERYDGPRGARDQSTWLEYTVDLSAYAGQEIWVAVRHFNCSDMFYLDVDDITLGVPEKGAYATAETCGMFKESVVSRAMWDLVFGFDGTSGYQYGVASDGEYIYTSSWSSSSTSMFYKYDMQGNFIEEFNISGCGQIRDLTYDGEYFYGVANASTIYCVDLANHTLIGQTTSAYGAMRCCAYDPERDGFWVVGNWEGNLTLVDRTGAIVTTGPAPTSASGVAYFKDDNGVEHVYCLNNGTNDVDDYNITTNTITSAVFNLNSNPVVTGSTGGCYVGAYDGKTCLFADIQQSPQYIAIYELSATAPAPTPGGQTINGLTPNAFNIAIDTPDNVVAAVSTSYATIPVPDNGTHTYFVFFVDAYYGVSCPAEVEYICLDAIDENAIVNAIYPNPTSGDLHIAAEAMTRISIVNAMGQMVYEQNVNADEITLDMAKYEAGIYMVNIYTENGSSVKRVTVVK